MQAHDACRIRDCLGICLFENRPAQCGDYSPPFKPSAISFSTTWPCPKKRPAKIVSNQLNLCVEVWDYKPVSEKVLLSLFDKAASQNEIS